MEHALTKRTNTAGVLTIADQKENYDLQLERFKHFNVSEGLMQTHAIVLRKSGQMVLVKKDESDDVDISGSSRSANGSAKTYAERIGMDGSVRPTGKYNDEYKLMFSQPVSVDRSEVTPMFNPCV